MNYSKIKEMLLFDQIANCKENFLILRKKTK